MKLPNRSLLDRLLGLRKTDPNGLVDPPMQGKNHNDDPGKGSAVNREIKANEATRVIDDLGLPPQPGPIPRQVPAPVTLPAPTDAQQAAHRQAILEQTRVAVTPAPLVAPAPIVASAQPQTRFIGAYAAETPLAPQPDKKPMAHAGTPMMEQSGPVVGWLVVIGGPGRGRYRAIGEGSNPIGRAPSQRIPLDFGDDAISSERQAYLIYDPQQRDFLLVPNLERSNLVSLNGSRVTGAMTLKAGDLIAMGQTKLYFQPLCGPHFDWTESASVTHKPQM